MSESDVNRILIELAEFKATVNTKLDNIAADHKRGEKVEADHESRIRALEAVRWKVAGIAATAGLLTGGGLAAVLSKVLGG